ncbi:MAG: response regulator [Terriglobia bacterium]|jgi:HD-like signal output (HDOD) protein
MRRVLFVDDEPRILEGLRRMLRPQRHEWEMAFAPGGEAALALMEASPFDVIVSDMRMPGIDGATLLCRVREQYPQMVRIVLSGHTELSTALRVVPVAHQFLAKPCDAEMLRVAVERACHLKALLSDESIRRTVSALGDLPSLPRTYEALTQALADPDTSLQKVAKIIEQDVGVSAKVLQLVNSAFFGVAHSITNIQSAVSYLGINTLKNLVLSVEIFRAFKPKRELPGFSLEKLQHHAQLTAHIAARLPVPKHLADIAVVAGMLHDLGKLILAWKLSEHFEKVLGEALGARCPAYTVEERDDGFSHAEIGAYLLGLWGLPYSVVEGVALHHGPNRVPHQAFDAISAVYVANLLAHELEEPSTGELAVYNLENYQEEFASLGVGEMIPQWRAMAKEIPALLVEV